MPRLSLDSLTLTDTQPQEIIKAAQSAGFDIVSLWVQAPALFPSPLLSAEKERECSAILADSDLKVVTLEVFELHSLDAIENYRDALERGARLGAETALAINFGKEDRGETAAILAKFAEVAGEYGLAVNLEPIAGGRTRTLRQASDLIRASGADVGITFDPWHVIGGGGSAADLEQIDTSLIRYVQLCDGPMPIPSEKVGVNAVCERQYPGDGAFPLGEMLRRLPLDVPIGIECPSIIRAHSGRTASDQAREAIAAMRRTLAAVR